MKNSVKMSFVAMMMVSTVLFSCATPTEKIEQAEENVEDSKKAMATVTAMVTAMVMVMVMVRKVQPIMEKKHLSYLGGKE
jgi:hypothetical protein